MIEANSSKFMTKKWNIANDNSNVNYDEGNETNYNTEVLKSNLCDYKDAYILVKGDITVTIAPKKQIAFRNCALFTRSIIKIHGTTIGDAEDLNLFMAMYILIEYISNYFQTTRSLCFYSKDEATDFNADIANNNLKSFEYKTKLLETAVAQTAPREGILE